MCTYRLKMSKAMRGAWGMLHLGVADWVGQNPVVKTRTNRSTPYRFICKIPQFDYRNWHITNGRSQHMYILFMVNCFKCKPQ